MQVARGRDHVRGVPCVWGRRAQTWLVAAVALAATSPRRRTWRCAVARRSLVPGKQTPCGTVARITQAPGPCHDLSVHAHACTLMLRRGCHPPPDPPHPACAHGSTAGWCPCMHLSRCQQWRERGPFTAGAHAWHPCRLRTCHPPQLLGCSRRGGGTPVWHVLTGQVRFASLARLGVQPDERSSECTERRLFATAARAWPEHPPPPTRRRAWYAAEPCTCWSKCGGGGRRLHGCPPVECAQAAHTPPRT